MGKEREMHTKVVGVTKKNEDDEKIQELLENISDICYEGELLSLEHESDNPYDENAIKVFYEHDHIGYINRELAKELAPLVDQQRVEAELCEVTGGEDGKSYGCNILIRIVSDEETARTDSREFVHLGSLNSDRIYEAQGQLPIANNATNQPLEKDWVDKIQPILPLVYIVWFCGIAAATFFLLSLIFK